MMDIVIKIAILIVIIEIIIGMGVFGYRNYINKPTSSNVMPYEMVIFCLYGIIDKTFELFDTDVFTYKKNISNSDFENYYREINARIVNSISNDLMNQLIFYFTYEAVIRLIASQTKKYLTEKIYMQE